MLTVKNFLLVFLGGGVGASLRFGASLAMNLVVKKVWASTLLVNIVGCFLFFMLNKFYSHLNKDYQVLFKIGILGALTTFSTFIADVVELFKNGQIKEAIAVICLNLVTGIIIGLGFLR